MRTDELIAALAADTTPGQKPALRLALGLAPALLAALAALLAFWGLRAELAETLRSVALVKTLGPLALGAAALWLATELARPEATARRQRAVLAVLATAPAVAFVLALGQGGGAALASEMARSSLWTCLGSVPLLALLPLAAMLWTLRAGAPARPGLAGAVAGLTAGCFAASVYSLYCTQDAPLFYLPAYGAAIGIVTLAGAALGARLLRW